MRWVLVVFCAVLGLSSASWACRMVCMVQGKPKSLLILCDNAGKTEDHYAVQYKGEVIVDDLICDYGKKDPFISRCKSEDGGEGYVVNTTPIVVEETRKVLSEKLTELEVTSKRSYLEFTVKNPSSDKKWLDEEEKIPAEFTFRFDQKKEECGVSPDR